MNRVGQVIESNGDFAVIEINRTSACGSCHACDNGSEESKEMKIKCHNTLEAKVGDYVEIDMENRDVLLAAFIAYGIPFIALLTGILLADQLFNSELISVIMGFSFLAIAYLMISKRESTFAQSKKYLPEIVKVVYKYEGVCLNID
jgi:sigma-E factor negative regulatory protein RseC